MIADRRTLAYIVIAVILGAALALAVALSYGSETTSGVSAAQGQAGLAAQTDVLGSDEGAAGVAVADPARAEAVLDQFKAKDPFIPLPTSSPTPSPTPSPTSTAVSYTARIAVNGTEYSVENGDKVPTSSPAFKITGITSGDVTFTVIDGELKNGDSSITVNLGESVKATLDDGKSYNLSVLSIGQGGGGGGGGETGGHSISVLSITTSNGTAMCTLEVDGKTYSDLKVGDVVETSWGEIAIIAINVSAQTVTVMHGDQTLVLHAGQVVVK
jgi:hypothetical protein